MIKDYFSLKNYLMQGKAKQSYPRFDQHPSIYPTDSLDSKLQYAHYSDNRFSKEQLVYLGCSIAELKKLSWEYDDRMRQWDYDKFDKACKYAKSKGCQGRTANQWYHIIDYYHDGKVELKAIATGFNLSNGYDYYVLGTLTK